MSTESSCFPTPQEEQLLQSIHPVSRETISRLARYRELLSTWQAKTNLVAPGTLPDFWRRHVADSLQILSLCGEARHFLDIGSGGGFPGMVVAIANSQRNGVENHLVESVNKKCAFLREVASATGANCQIHCERIESATKRLVEASCIPQIVTARALAPLPKLLDLAAPVLSRGATGLFHKGREHLLEIEECRGLWQFDLVVHPSRMEAGSVVLEIRNARKVDG